MINATAVNTIDYLAQLSVYELLENPYPRWSDGRYFTPTNDQAIAYTEISNLIIQKPTENSYVLLGESGMGKTLLAKRLVDMANKGQHSHAAGIYFASGELTQAKVLKKIFARLDLPSEPTIETRLQALQKYLISRNQADEKFSLFLAIDGKPSFEAFKLFLEIVRWQYLNMVSPEERDAMSLSEIGILQNHSFFQLLFTGYPLNNLFSPIPKYPGFSVFIQKILTISPLYRPNVAPFLEGQAMRAGAKRALFDKAAVLKLAAVTSNLRKLNEHAEMCVELMISREEDLITEGILNEVILLHELIRFENKPKASKLQPSLDFLAGHTT